MPKLTYIRLGLCQDQLSALQSASAQSGAAISELIRRAINAAIKPVK